MKYNSRGEFLMSWGETGYAPGQFRALHAIALHPDGRVFVGDRSNSRIQIFDQEGNHSATWTQFGRPSGIAFDDQGRIYVADSESDNVQNPGYEMGIRIGEVEMGWVKELAISEFPKGRKYLISLSFRGKSSVRPVQVGGSDVNIVPTAVRGRSGPVRHHAWLPALGAILSPTDGPRGS